MNANALSSWTIGLAATILLSACNDHQDNPPAPTVRFTAVSGSGDITAKVNEFRTLLGNPLNTTPNQTAGRREVNWDAVPANFTNTNTFPGDFFNNTDPAGPNGRKRGMVNSTPGSGFRISDNDFADLLAAYGDQFNTFSPLRLFTPIGSVITETTFRVPGTTTLATVKGFGVVFSDVDNANATTVEFFEGDKSLGVFKAPVRSDAAGLSFVGVVFPDNTVSKVVIRSGNAAIDGSFTDGGQYDLVVMDDFLFDEPRAN